MIASFITAIRTLTIFPVPGKDTNDFSASIKWFSLIGFILGAFMFAIVILLKPFSGFLSAEVLAIFLVLAITVMTRGLHLDGLADWADGFLGNIHKERTLAIMKDPHVGTFGIVALFILLMMKWVFFKRLIVEDLEFLIIGPYVISRTAMASLSVLYNYGGDQDGLGKSFIANAKRSNLYFALTITVVLLSFLYGVSGILLFGTALIFERVLGYWFARKLGGVTGDLLGAACEISETAFLFIFFIVMKYALEILPGTVVNFGVSVYF